MISEGLQLMVIGMATVFAFLALLVGCMTLAGRVFRRWNHLLPDEEPVAKSTDTGARIAVAIASAARKRGRI